MVRVIVLLVLIIKIDVLSRAVTVPFALNIGDMSIAWSQIGSVFIIFVSLMLICSIPFAAKESVFAVAADRPVFVLPVNFMDGFVAVPCVNVTPVAKSAVPATFIVPAFIVVAPIELAPVMPKEFMFTGLWKAAPVEYKLIC
jgi:hypothetical protein